MESVPPYRDPSRAIEERARDLLARMTPEEKIAQLGCVWSTALVEDGGFSEERARQLLVHGTGHVTRIGSSTGLRPTESAAFMNRIQCFLQQHTRLGIPALVHEESTAGFCARDANQFPQAIGLASTWDPEAVRSVAEVIREQMLAVGARQTLAPVLDVARDPRWGRVEETYGEDPYLIARLGVAYVQGLQTDRLAEGVAATGKHFLGYGLSEGGHNHKPVHLGPRELREVFARPFLAAIQEAGIASIMNAYNEIDGLPCGGSEEILTGLLREELGFDGVVVADYFTTGLLIHAHRVAADRGDAGQMALEAGLDVELPALDCYGELVARLADGRLAPEVVDRSVLRQLRLKLELGLFERATVEAERAALVYQRPQQRALAREIAARSLVLLRNEGGLLPLARDLASLAVVGPCADDRRLLLGDYHYPVHMEIIYERDDAVASEVLPQSGEVAFAPGPYYVPIVTPLEGIRAAVAASCRIHTARGCDVLGDDARGLPAAVAAAREAEVALVFVGGRSGLRPHCTSGEFRDAAELGLTGLQQQLVEAVVATGTPTVVALLNGRVLALPWIAEHVPALLECWLPGEEGGHAIADVLFGAVNPAGRLPVTVPRTVGQVPLYARARWSAHEARPFPPHYADCPASPLFPFGHGLSYTRFRYGPVELGATQVRPDQPVEVAVAVTNEGPRAGEEVVQLYLRDPVASVTRPVQQLAGFARIALEAGETARVAFRVDPSQLAFYDRAMRFVVEPGRVRVCVGASSADLRSEGELEIVGPLRELSPRELVPTRVQVERQLRP